jgi:hypothetical protein
VDVKPVRPDEAEGYILLNQETIEEWEREIASLKNWIAVTLEEIKELEQYL